MEIPLENSADLTTQALKAAHQKQWSEAYGTMLKSAFIDPWQPDLWQLRSYLASTDPCSSWPLWDGSWWEKVVFVDFFWWTPGALWALGFWISFVLFSYVWFRRQKMELLKKYLKMKNGSDSSYQGIGVTIGLVIFFGVTWLAQDLWKSQKSGILKTNKSLHSYHDENASILKELKAGQWVFVLDERNNYALVKTPGEWAGWLPLEAIYPINFKSFQNLSPEENHE